MAFGNWRTNLVIVGSVIFTLIVGLLLSQFDYLEQRYLPTVQPIAGNGLITEVTQTPLPAIPLPSDTPTVPATNTAVPPPTPELTAVAVLASCGQIPVNWIPRMVQSGDTLSSLSLIYGATVEDISQANCLQMEKLFPGTIIYLPPVPIQRAACSVPANWVPYIVQPGDTLFSLAVSRGVTVYQVMQANCFVDTYLRAAQKIYLPYAPPVWPTATMTPQPSATATGLPTMTATPDTTISPTSTSTISATLTPTGTNTATVTPTPPATGTVTATPTVQFTPTVTATAPPSGSATATSTATVVATIAPTSLPTATATPLPTAAPTAVPTAMATLIPTVPPTAVPTNTAVPTAIP